jgi:hypothetical protein
MDDQERAEVRRRELVYSCCRLPRPLLLDVDGREYDAVLDSDFTCTNLPVKLRFEECQVTIGPISLSDSRISLWFSLASAVVALIRNGRFKFDTYDGYSGVELLWDSHDNVVWVQTGYQEQEARFQPGQLVNAIVLLLRRILQAMRKSSVPTDVDYVTSMLEWGARIDAVTHCARLSAIRRVATTICLGLQDLDLPALISIEIIDAAFTNAVDFGSMWKLVTAVKHFHTKTKR